MAGRGLTAKGASTAVMVGVYALALAVGVATALAMPNAPLWWRLLAADLAGTFVVWIAGVLVDNTSIYDPYWSVAPLPLALAAWLAGGGDRAVLAAVCVTVWGARLTWNFWRGWSGFGHEDWRYDAYRRLGVVPYWALSLVGLMSMPTLMVFGGMLPVIQGVSSVAPLGMWDALAAATAMGFLAIETVADEQLRAYRKTQPEPGSFLQTGLWGWSRHPNYLGEIGFWWGIALFGVASGVPWTLAGAAGITLLFVTISVPLIDKRMNERRPTYAAHCRRIPAIFPVWFGRG